MAVGQVLVTTHVITDLPADRIEEQGIDGEVAAQRVFLERAEDVVAQDAAVFEFVVVVAAGGRLAAEGCHLDQVPRLAHMRQAKTPADQTTAREHVLNLLGRGAGGHVEILGRLAQQKVADTAADDVGLVPCILQIFHHLGGVGTQFFESDPAIIPAPCRADPDTLPSSSG